MNKKPFNWVGFIWIFALVGGLIFCFGGAIWGSINPKWWFAAFMEGSNGSGRDTIGYLTGFGFMWLIIGGILAPAFYKKSVRNINAKWAFETAAIQTVTAKVISKISQVVGDRFSTGTIYHVSFDFPDGSRNSFSVNAVQYSVLVENEVGLLTYKQQEDYMFFVDFQRQS